MAGARTRLTSRCRRSALAHAALPCHPARCEAIELFDMSVREKFRDLEHRRWRVCWRKVTTGCLRERTPTFVDFHTHGHQPGCARIDLASLQDRVSECNWFALHKLCLHTTPNEHATLPE